MTNVATFTPRLVGDGIKVDCEAVLANVPRPLREVVVIGIDEDGELFLASSEGVPTAVFLMERAKAFLVQNEVLRGG